MSIAINDSYAAYVYLVLLKTSLFFLQRPSHLRQITDKRGDSLTVNVIIDFYCQTTALIASVLNWGTLVLAIYIGYEFGIVTGILFFSVGSLGMFILQLIIPPLPGVDIVAHLITLPAVPYLIIGILETLEN